MKIYLKNINNRFVLVDELGEDIENSYVVNTEIVSNGKETPKVIITLACPKDIEHICSKFIKID